MYFEIKINDKLSLKMPELKDSKEIFDVVDKDRKHLGEWLVWVEKTISPKDIENNITERIEKFNEKKSASFYAYYDKQWIASVGYISLDNINKKGEIGYWISSEFEGKGLMTECVKACLKYGFEDLCLNRIIIKCDNRNNRSGSIPKRLGFTLEGTLREDHFRDGVYSDTLVFSLLKSEWKQ